MKNPYRGSEGINIKAGLVRKNQMCPCKEEKKGKRYTDQFVQQGDNMRGETQVFFLKVCAYAQISLLMESTSPCTSDVSPF